MTFAIVEVEREQEIGFAYEFDDGTYSDMIFTSFSQASAVKEIIYKYYKLHNANSACTLKEFTIAFSKQMKLSEIQ